MKGKRSREMVSARIRLRSENVTAEEKGCVVCGCSRSAAEERTGVINSSEMTVMRKMQPKTASVL